MKLLECRLAPYGRIGVGLARSAVHERGLTPLSLTTLCFSHSHVKQVIAELDLVWEVLELTKPSLFPRGQIQLTAAQLTKPSLLPRGKLN